MGATVEERPDGLRVEGRSRGKLRGAEIEPYGDHRIAMAFAVAALAASGPTLIRDAIAPPCPTPLSSTTWHAWPSDSRAKALHKNQ